MDIWHNEVGGSASPGSESAGSVSSGGGSPGSESAGGEPPGIEPASGESLGSRPASGGSPGSDRAPAAFGLAGGCAAVVIVALVAAGLFAPGDLAGRAAAMAVAVGVLAAVLVDWRASAGVAVVAALIFVGFLAHRDGELTGSATAWPYAAAIGVTLILGRGGRWIRSAAVERVPSVLSADHEPARALAVATRPTAPTTANPAAAWRGRILARASRASRQSVGGRLVGSGHRR
jgi:hypothetical protein